MRFYVDTENVGLTWVNDLAQLTEADHVIVFYTINSQHLTFPIVEHMVATKASLEFVECFTGTNALDFQLVTRLGYDLKSYPRSQFIIISKDRGFNAVSNFWRKQGKEVTRTDSIGTFVEVIKQYRIPAKRVAKFAKTIDVEMTPMDAIGYLRKQAVSSSDCHNALQGVYGMKGREIFQFIREECLCKSG